MPLTGISRVCAHIFPRSKFSSNTLLQHPPMPSCYGFGGQFAAVRGGNCWKSLQEKQNRPRQKDRQTDRQLLLLAPPIRLLGPLPLICFFDGTKSEMIVINYLPY